MSSSIQSRNSYSNQIKFHPNLEIHDLRNIKWNDSFFFILDKRAKDFRVSMKNLLIKLFIYI